MSDRDVRLRNLLPEGTVGMTAAHIQAINAVIEKLTAERDAAREALRKYGTHPLRCKFYTRRVDGDCDCGFPAALGEQP